MTQIHADLANLLQLINSMIVMTQWGWTIYLSKSDKWMGNCVMGTNNEKIEYMRLRPLGL